VVLRDGSSGLEVVLVGKSDPTIWGLPKGGPSGEENLEQTAVRETTEETGLDVELVEPIGAIDYWFSAGGRRVHKTVHYYLTIAVGGDTSRHDAEHDRVAWVSLDDAYRLMSYENERAILRQAVDLWRQRKSGTSLVSSNDA
jgi:8-oxo-dGTP pyrophosphatase MutT (NUDIX family)